MNRRSKWTFSTEHQVLTGAAGRVKISNTKELVRPPFKKWIDGLSYKYDQTDKTNAVPSRQERKKERKYLICVPNTASDLTKSITLPVPLLKMERNTGTHATITRSSKSLLSTYMCRGYR